MANDHGSLQLASAEVREVRKKREIVCPVRQQWLCCRQQKQRKNLFLSSRK